MPFQSGSASGLWRGAAKQGEPATARIHAYARPIGAVRSWRWSASDFIRTADSGGKCRSVLRPGAEMAATTRLDLRPPTASASARHRRSRSSARVVDHCSEDEPGAQSRAFPLPGWRRVTVRCAGRATPAYAWHFGSRAVRERNERTSSMGVPRTLKEAGCRRSGRWMRCCAGDGGAGCCWPGGPPRPPCRRRPQTTASCCGQEPWW
jgi:hypothetical protein